MDYWQEFVASFHVDERIFFVVGTWLLVNGIVWSTNLILYFMYITNAFPENRIIPDVFPTPELIKECLISCVFGNVLVLPVILYFAYPSFISAGVSITDPAPSMGIMLRDWLVSIVLNDTLFYWGHRLLHHPAIYKYIHKHHHRFNYSIGIAAQFAHPVEDILANIIPTIIGSLLMKSHLLTIWIWLIIRLFETIYCHSGYTFRYCPYNWFPSIQGGSERHYFHHSHNVGCYGSFTAIWDRMMGTDEAFQVYQAEKKKMKIAKKAE